MKAAGPPLVVVFNVSAGHAQADEVRATLQAGCAEAGRALHLLEVQDPRQLGAIARPARVRFVTLLPKTRSGKLLRRAIQAVCEGRDAGDLTTIEDPAALEQIRDMV